MQPRQRQINSNSNNVSMTSCHKGGIKIRNTGNDKIVDPFAGVNPALVERLLTVLNAIRAKHSLSFLLVEHDLETVMSISDKVVVMAQGEVIASGLPGSIYDNEVVVDAYLGSRKRNS